MAMAKSLGYGPERSPKRPGDSSDLRSFQTDVLQGRHLCSPPGNVTSTCQKSGSLSSVHLHYQGMIEKGAPPLYSGVQDLLDVSVDQSG